MAPLIGLNLGLFDLWSVVHFLAGFMLAVVGLRLSQRRIFLWMAVVSILLIGWEVLEIAQGRGGFGGSESGPNIIVDIVIGAVGAWAAVLIMDSDRKRRHTN